MAFFSRPNLDNVQFKQLSGTTLTLSGITQIATISGFTLTDGAGSNIIVTAEGAGISGQVLAYDGAGKIRLADPSSGASTGIYTCASPTTCTVGGLNACTDICNWQIDTILQAILVPTLCSTITAPSSTFTITCSPTTSTGFYEMGTTVCVTGCSIFNRGCVDPAYCCVFGDGSDKRSGVPLYHYYVDWGTPVTCTTTDLNNCIPFTPVVINSPSQSVSGRVFYNASSNNVLMSDGVCQPSGVTFYNPLPSGCTASISRVVCGMYPYFYGKVCSGNVAAGVNRPTDACIKSIITGGTVGGGCTCNKVICSSVNTIYVNFASTSDDYLWFAIPSGSTIKTCWCVDALNKGTIGGVVSAGGNLFPAHSVVTGVQSNLSCWSGQTYQFYVSNYQSLSNTIMQLRNS